MTTFFNMQSKNKKRVGTAKCSSRWRFISKLKSQKIKQGIFRQRETKHSAFLMYRYSIKANQFCLVSALVLNLSSATLMNHLYL